jgi:hypothetical protein
MKKKMKGPMRKKQKIQTCEAVIPIKQEGQKSHEIASESCPFPAGLPSSKVSSY